MTTTLAMSLAIEVMAIEQDDKEGFLRVKEIAGLVAEFGGEFIIPENDDDLNALSDYEKNRFLKLRSSCGFTFPKFKYGSFNDSVQDRIETLNSAKWED